jgi:hypothetical protein
MEEVPAPVDQQQDSVAVVVRYVPSEGGRDAPNPLALRFEVARARVHDLRLHLEAHSTVLCQSDYEGSGHSAARVDVPPFQGQSGLPVP